MTYKTSWFLEKANHIDTLIFEDTTNHCPCYLKNSHKLSHSHGGHLLSPNSNISPIDTTHLSPVQYNHTKGHVHEFFSNKILE